MFTAKQVLDQSYLEVRCALVEIAATLDRHDRGAGMGGHGADRQAANGQMANGSAAHGKGSAAATQKTDPRIQLLQQAIALLSEHSPEPNRAERMLLLFSDPA